MHSLEIENQIQLADVVEQAVKGLDEDLDKVEESEGGFGGGADKDEVEGRIVPIGDVGGAVGIVAGISRGGGSGGWSEKRR